MGWFTEARRAWIYRILTAAAPLGIAYGAVDGNKAALWVTLGGTVLGFGMAAANTSTHPDQ